MTHTYHGYWSEALISQFLFDPSGNLPKAWKRKLREEIIAKDSGMGFKQLQHLKHTSKMV